MKKLLNIIGGAAFNPFATKLQFVLVMRAAVMAMYFVTLIHFNIIVVQLIYHI